MSSGGNPSQPASIFEAVAQHVTHDIPLNAADPAGEWARANPLTFSTDWRGEIQEGCETLVRILWNSETLYLRFVCRFRELYVFSDSEANGRRDHLWDRDVAEAFLQPDPSRPRFYKEFEISPNGMWIDLDISPAGLANLQSGMQRSVILDEKQKTWSAELSIPMAALTPRFRSGEELACQFLSHRRGLGAALVHGLEPDPFSAAQLPCPGGVRRSQVQ